MLDHIPKRVIAIIFTLEVEFFNGKRNMWLISGRESHLWCYNVQTISCIVNFLFYFILISDKKKVRRGIVNSQFNITITASLPMGFANRETSRVIAVSQLHKGTKFI